MPPGPRRNHAHLLWLLVRDDTQRRWQRRLCRPALTQPLERLLLGARSARRLAVWPRCGRRMGLRSRSRWLGLWRRR